MFVPPNRSPLRRTLTDAAAKHILSNSDLSWSDTGYWVRGRIIGWRRTASGALGAIVAFPSGARHLFGVDFGSGKPKRLAPLA